MSLIDDIERLGHALEHGASRGEAIRGLCQASAGGLTGPGAGDLLDDWRNARRRYEAVFDASAAQLDALLAVWRIEHATRPDTTDTTGA